MFKHCQQFSCKKFCSCSCFVFHKFASLQIYCEVIPKRHALSQANAELETATAKLLSVQKKLAVSKIVVIILESLFLIASNFNVCIIYFFVFFLQDLDASVQSLTAQFERATAEKISCQEEVARTNQTIELANRLVKGLEVNKERSNLVVTGADLA